MLNPDRYLVTSALPYANGPLHIGHLSGAYLSADIYVRFLRLMSKDVVFICGSDENGAAITMKALKEDKSPQEIVDKYHQLFKKAFDGLDISFDIYHRTSSQLHHETSQEFFRTLYNKGEFDEIEGEQYFDVEAQQFLADRYITGTCPKCGHLEAYGDQCENCGSSLSPTELIDPKSTISGSQPVLKTTKHWYLPLDRYESWLSTWINEGRIGDQQMHEPSEWKNHVLGQCKSWLEGGLQPRAMTRDLDWGIDVPKEIEGSEGKKLYVWLDAPIGYISATKQWALDNNKDWEPYWKDSKTSLVHFIGKDNIVFHCLIFPSILKAHGEYILPDNVPANQFVNLEGQKISTSKNWAIWVNEYLEELPGKEDELRYHMIKNMPEQRDSEFTWKGFQESVNNELVNNLANFINRVVVLTNKYYDGTVPEFDEDVSFESGTSQDFDGFHDGEMLQLHDDLQDLCDQVRKYEFRSALKTLMKISSQGNQLLQFNEPWKKIKEDPEVVKVVMNLSLQIVTSISVAMSIFMPFTSKKLRGVLNISETAENGSLEKLLTSLAEGEHLIEAGHKIGKSQHLFTRFDDKLIDEQKSKLIKASEEATESMETVEPIKNTIQYDDFAKMDLRIGTVLSAEKVKKTDKLVKIELDIGSEVRTVISGIAQHFEIDELIGKQVCLLANLAPRKMRGIESQGMILLAEDADERLIFVSPEAKTTNGSVVK